MEQLAGAWVVIVEIPMHFENFGCSLFGDMQHRHIGNLPDLIVDARVEEPVGVQLELAPGAGKIVGTASAFALSTNSTYCQIAHLCSACSKEVGMTNFVCGMPQNVFTQLRIRDASGGGEKISTTILFSLRKALQCAVASYWISPDCAIAAMG